MGCVLESERRWGCFRLKQRAFHLIGLGGAKSRAREAIEAAAEKIARDFLKYKAFEGRTVEDVKNVLMRIKSLRERAGNFRQISKREVSDYYTLAEKARFVKEGMRQFLYLKPGLMNNEKIRRLFHEELFLEVKPDDIRVFKEGLNKLLEDAGEDKVKQSKAYRDVAENLMDVVYKNGHTTEADLMFQRAAELDPDGFFKHYKAIDDSREGVDDAKRSIAFVQLSYCYEKGVGVEGNDDEAFFYAVKAYSLGQEDDPLALYWLGWLHYEGIGTRVDNKRALELWEQAVKEDPKYADALNGCGAIYNKRKDLHNSLAFFKRSIKEHSVSSGTLFNLGKTYMQKSNGLANFRTFKKFRERGLACLKRAIEIDAKYSNALYWVGDYYRGYTYLGIGPGPNYKKVYKYLKRAVEADPENGGALKDLAKLYAKGHEVRKDADVADFFTSLSKHSRDAVEAVPIFFLDVERASEEGLRKALEAYKGGLYRLNKIGEENLRHRVEVLVERLDALSKESVSLSKYLGEYYFKEWEDEKALRYYKQAEGLSRQEQEGSKEKKDEHVKIIERIAFLKCLIESEKEEVTEEVYVTLAAYYREGRGTERDTAKGYRAIKKVLGRKDGKNSKVLLKEIGLTAKEVAEYCALIDDLEKRIRDAKEVESKGGRAALKFYAEVRILQIKRCLIGDKGPFIDFGKFLNDPEMKVWNVLKLPEEKIDDDAWGLLEGKLASIMESLLPGDKKASKNGQNFMKMVMEAKDAKSDAGKAHVRKRVASVIDFVIKEREKVIAKESKLGVKEKEAIDERMKKILGCLAYGGEACADRAIVGLEKAENCIKMYAGDGEKSYYVNVVANLFKKHVIEAQLATVGKQKDPIETFLYYLLQFDKFLGLGVATKEMRFRNYATIYKFGEALGKVYKLFTEEDLIGYLENHEAFKSRYEKERLKAIEALLEKMGDIDYKAPGAKEKMQGIVNEKDEVERTFFKDKAKALLKEAGFLTDRVDYEDLPDSVFVA